MLPEIFLSRYNLNCCKIEDTGPTHKYYRPSIRYPYFLFSGELYLSYDGKFHITFDDAYKHTFG